MTRLVRRAPPRILLLVLTLWLTACGTALAPRAPAPREDSQALGSTLIRSELLFGRARPAGGIVSDEEWAAFVDEHVTPRFPDGLTILDAVGQYRTRAGRLVREPSKIILLLHEEDAESRASIWKIRSAYKRLFDQESVLLITSIARVSF